MACLSTPSMPGVPAPLDASVIRAASAKRDELRRDGRGQEVDETIKRARNAQAEILSGSR